jgi:hypothetical protein
MYFKKFNLGKFRYQLNIIEYFIKLFQWTQGHNI